MSSGQHVEASCPPPSVTVVIPAYQGAATITKTLRSLSEQTGVQRLEVIVVESSADGAADIIASEFPWVTVLRQPARLSAGAARNRGASLAKGEYVIFIDQDCIAPGDWIERIVAHLQRPGVDAVGGSVGIANPANLSGAAVYFLEFMRHFPRRGVLEADVFFLLGCNAGYRAEVLRSVVYPDRTLAEDVIFTERVRQAGYGVFYDPGLVVLHHNRTGWGEFFRYAAKMGGSAADYHAVMARCWMKPFQCWPALILVAAPGVTPWIACRLLRSRCRYLALFLLVSPACLLGNFVWAVSYYRGVRRNRRRRSASPAARNGSS